MKATNQKQEKPQHRKLDVLFFALIHPFKRIANSDSMNLEARDGNASPSNTYIFDEAPARLNAVYPWIQFA